MDRKTWIRTAAASLALIVLLAGAVTAVRALRRYSVDAEGGVSLPRPHPLLREKEKILIRECAREGIPIKVTEDVRDRATQDRYFEQGASQVSGLEYDGLHQWGVAFDICINVVGKAYDEDLLDRVGEIGKSLGLEWGGDWTDFVDKPHFQLKEMITEDGQTVNRFSRDYLKAHFPTPKEFADSW